MLQGCGSVHAKSRCPSDGLSQHYNMLSGGHRVVVSVVKHLLFHVRPYSIVFRRSRIDWNTIALLRAASYSLNLMTYKTTCVFCLLYYKKVSKGYTSLASLLQNDCQEHKRGRTGVDKYHTSYMPGQFY